MKNSIDDLITMMKTLSETKVDGKEFGVSKAMETMIREAFIDIVEALNELKRIKNFFSPQ